MLLCWIIVLVIKKSSAQQVDPCSSCSVNAQCINTNGVRQCVCNNGFSGNGTTCTASDPCSSCSVDAQCVTTNGARQCFCNFGFYGDGNICLVDPCSSCSLNAQCVTTNGVRQCACNNDFIGNGTTCTSIYGAWSAWDTCSESCQSNPSVSPFQTQTRQCLGATLNDSCPGITSQTQPCNTGVSCPGILNAWGAWGLCSASCQMGYIPPTQTSSRQCNGATFVGNCNGASLTQTQNCSEQIKCPGTISGWSSWGACSASCNNLVTVPSRTRSQYCIGYSTFDSSYKGCDGIPTSDQQACNETVGCPGAYGEWSAWSICSETCQSNSNAAPFQTRIRQCIMATLGVGCVGPSYQAAFCNSGVACPGILSGWSAWGACSCQFGFVVPTQVSTRSCSGSSLGNNCNGQALNQTQNCNAEVSCPDFQFSTLFNSTIEATAGSVLIIPRCQLTSKTFNVSITKSDIFWVKDDLFLSATDNPTPLQTAGTWLFPTLQINKATLSDNGIYQCGVQTVQMGQPVLSDIILVTIIAQTVEFASQISFQNTYNNAILFNCTYNANEDLSGFSYWLLNGVTKFETFNSLANQTLPALVGIPPRHFGQYEVPALHITNYNMTGSYQCVVFNNKTMYKEFKSNVFNIPRQPDPVFLNNPTLLSASLNSINIVGCSFNTYFELKYGGVYFIKDDTTKIYTSASSANYLNKNPPYMYKLANLAMEGPIISYDAQGYYQCAISISGYNSSEIRSAPVDVILPYTSNTKIRLNLYTYWTPEYLNQTSKAFLELKYYKEIFTKQLAQIVTQNITGTSPKTIIQTTGVGVFTYRLNESLYITSRLTILGVNDSTKLQIYNALLQNNNADSFKELGVVNIELTSLDFCPQSIFGEENYKGEYAFEVTKINYVVTKNCTYQSQQTFVGRCVGNLKDGPAWNISDLSRCVPKSPTTIILENLSKQMICLNNFTMNCSLLSVLSNNLSVAVANGSTITNYHDINLIAKTLETIINVYPNAKGASIQVFRDVLQTIDNLLDSNETYIAESQIKTSSSTSILNTLTEFALIYSKQLNSSISIGKTNIGFYIDKVKKGNIIISAQQLSNDSVGISFNNNTDFTNKTYAIIKIPSEVFSNDNEVIYSYFFRYDSFLLNEDSLLKLTSKNTFNKSFLQSTILSASVVNKNVSNLMNPIVLTFKKMQNDNLGTSRCSYWDKNIETEIRNVYGKWLTAGCYEYTDDFNTNDFFTCACNHLTNFALLLDVNQKSYNPLALSIVTYIGCGVSLLGLSLTLFTLALFRNLRKKLLGKILICLCASLSAFLIVFLIGAEKTLPRRGCQVFAALIHYFILSTFCWMLVQAFSLLRSFVIVFKKRSDSNIFRNANLFAWGVPVVIVVISAILKPDQLGNDKVCLVQGYPFYFAVLLPVCLILMVNYIVLISTMLSLSKRVVTANKTSEKHYYLSQVRLGFMFSILLGSSWLFGVLAFKDLSTVFQWLFCISTSLQGCFIFVFFILIRKDVFVEWRLFFSIIRHYVSPTLNAQINPDCQLPDDPSSNVQLSTITYY